MEKLKLSCFILVVTSIAFLILSFFPIYPSNQNIMTRLKQLEQQFALIEESTSISLEGIGEVIKEEDFMNKTSKEEVQEKIKMVIEGNTKDDIYIYSDEKLLEVSKQLAELYQVQLDAYDTSIVRQYKRIAQGTSGIVLILSASILFVLKKKKESIPVEIHKNSELS